MAKCVSGDVTVLVLDAAETHVLVTALKHLQRDDDECLILAHDWERGTLHGLIDAFGVE